METNGAAQMLLERSGWKKDISAKTVLKSANDMWQNTEVSLGAKIRRKNSSLKITQYTRYNLAA